MKRKLAWNILERAHKMDPSYKIGTFIILPVGVILYVLGFIEKNPYLVLSSFFVAGVIPPLFYGWLRSFSIKDSDKEIAKESKEIWGPVWVAALAFGTALYRIHFGN